MKVILILILTNFIIIRAQTLDNIKDQLNNAGLTPDQAKQIAKDRGYSDEMIESEIRRRGKDQGNEIKASEIISDSILVPYNTTINNNTLIISSKDMTFRSISDYINNIFMNFTLKVFKIYLFW